MRILGLDHVVLRCRDLERMLAFYTGVLGCSIARRNEPLGLIHLQAGSAQIDLVDVNGELGRAGGAPPGPEGHNMDHLCLRIEPFAVNRLRRQFRRHGIDLGPVHHNFGAEGYGWAVYLKDPEGNAIELKRPPQPHPPSGLPDGPRAPALWQQIHWIRDPFGYMRGAAERHGDTFTALIGQAFRPVVLCSDPAALEHLISSDEGEDFEAPGELNGLFEPLLGPESVITISGDRHRRMRRLLLPPFHGDRMRSYGETIQRITREVIAGWNRGEPVAVQAAMQTISMRVILRTVFGVTEPERQARLEAELAGMLEGISRPLSVAMLYFPLLRRDLGEASPWGRFVARRARVDRLIHEEIEARRRSPDPAREDILSLLMAARDEEGTPLRDDELRDELITLLVAGHETTATALTWALYWIHRLGPVSARLRAELEEAGEGIDPAGIARLPYLIAVCSETLRIYPVGMLTFPRVTCRPVALGDHILPAGTIVMGSIYLAHRRPSVYPEPERFDPDRFLSRSYSPYEFLPFGGGSRRCIGMAFAQYEMKLVLHTILSGPVLRLPEGLEAHPVRRGLTSGASPVRLEHA